MKGFLHLHRRYFKHPFWEERRTFSRAEAWLDLIQLAAYAEHQRLIRGQIVTVNRGEVLASFRFLGGRWGWSKDKVASFVRLLESETMVTRETRQGETVLILCKYETYNVNQTLVQDTDQTQTKTQKRQRPDSGQTNINKEKKGKREYTPLPPEGENIEAQREEAEPIPEESVMPAGWKRLTRSDRSTTRVLRNSERMIQLGSWFGRRPGTLWSVEEAAKLREINPSDEDVDLMEAYYTATIPKESDYRRRDLGTLLNRWNGELDRARIFLGDNPELIPEHLKR